MRVNGLSTRWGYKKHMNGYWTVPFITGHWPDDFVEYSPEYERIGKNFSTFTRLRVEPRFTEYIIDLASVKLTSESDQTYREFRRSFMRQNRTSWNEHFENDKDITEDKFRNFYYGDIFYGDGIFDLLEHWDIDPRDLTKSNITDIRLILEIYNRKNILLLKNGTVTPLNIPSVI